MTTQESPQELVQYRCKKCNAPYPLGADDVIATCPYCGYTFIVGGSELTKHMILPSRLDEKSVRKSVTKWLKLTSSKSVGEGIMKGIDLETPTLQWIPVFRVLADFEIHYLGAKQERSDYKKTWVKIEETNSGETAEWVLARRHAATFGVEEFIESLSDDTAKPFKIGMAESAPVLNSEIDEGDAPTRAHQRKRARDRAELQEQMEHLFDYHLKMNPKDCAYMHVPYWLARYTYKKGTFRVAVSGVTGNVVLGELPVTKLYRAKRWVTSLAMLIASALLMQPVPYILYALMQDSSSNGDAFMIPLGMAFLAVLLWGGAYTIVGGSLRYEICVTADGKERDKRFSFGGTMDDMKERIS